MSPSAEKDAVGSLSREHIGARVLGMPGIAGWERHLLLSEVKHAEGSTYLSFRWDDDPSPANTKRGQFAVGVTVPSDTQCRVIPSDDGCPDLWPTGEHLDPPTNCCTCVFPPADPAPTTEGGVEQERASLAKSLGSQRSDGEVLAFVSGYVRAYRLTQEAGDE